MTAKIALWTNLLRNKTKTATTPLDIGIVGSMNDQQEPVPANPDTPAVPVLDTDELNNLAKFLDALLEVDMEVKRNEGVSTNDNYLQAI